MISSVLILILGFGLPFGYFYFKKNPQFGGKITSSEKRRLRASKNWKGGKFLNLQKTTMELKISGIPGLIKESSRAKKTQNPKSNLKILPFIKKDFQKDGVPKFVWYGHSVLLLQIHNRNLLIDPMFGPDASPVGPIRTKRFSRSSLEIIDMLPDLDAILLTHDHYDHLDFQSIRKLKQKVGRFLVPLGVSRHLENWGIDKNSIQEFDWWDNAGIFDLELTFTPSRHFSGRGLADRAKSLWGGWVIKNQEFAVYWSGDGGYGDHFKEIGEKLGPFDWGFMECGQYNHRWHQIHMYPEEAVQAALDSRVQKAIPVHWGGFSLALHHWKDPIERFVKAASQNKIEFYTPQIGAIVNGNETTYEPWWEALD
ncbi:MBL fold metallo-hydrolase [Lutimonas zeaxanthinifaciens]|uniref:MBL fold metallo-hydrolase n=1 Tax=Lutimonas zeaxanthinifaciens TaxID=3060215 RepID=UPI00265D554D|nr:MBL fold metallo-hydrolase [Lutimonas sp. YSD2104]WKK64599.1 MBL fold metallo-hydrolase [Lutimonas sp. YSD2104]